jgi:hypothetical protein
MSWDQHLPMANVHNAGKLKFGAKGKNRKKAFLNN